jgi:hypothetical protein
MEFTSDLRTPFLGHALGFSVSRTRPHDGSRFEAFCERARAAMPRSGVLLLGPTPRWSLHTAWPADLDAEMGTQTCTNRRYLPRAVSGVRLYLLRPHEPVLTRCEATREALKFAAASALGVMQSASVSFGTALYDGLIDRLAAGANGLCPSDSGRGERCLARRLERAGFACTSAAGFLGKAPRFVPDLQHDRHLAGAADAFRTMAREFGRIAALPSLSQQSRPLVGQRLRRVRDLHQNAAAHLSDLCALL